MADSTTQKENSKDTSKLSLSKRKSMQDQQESKSAWERPSLKKAKGSVGDSPSSISEIQESGTTINSGKNSKITLTSEVERKKPTNSTKQYSESEHSHTPPSTCSTASPLGDSDDSISSTDTIDDTIANVSTTPIETISEKVYKWASIKEKLYSMQQIKGMDVIGTFRWEPRVKLSDIADKKLGISSKEGKYFGCYYSMWCSKTGEKKCIQGTFKWLDEAALNDVETPVNK